ncbi:MAG: SoxR reducing system RseC family protein [Clostridia bacterium]|nr:SoxR reducing system RseC family protein [Clostridia bacterium]
MKTKGTVLKIEGKYAIVGVKRHSACDTCRAQCGGHCDKASTVETKVLNSKGANVGDEVELYSKTSAVMGGALLVFILPLVMALIGYAIAYFLGARSIISALFSLIFFLSTFFIIWKIWGKKDKFTEIEMIRIVGDLK